jgi:hypothetical protein
MGLSLAQVLAVDAAAAVLLVADYVASRVILRVAEVDARRVVAAIKAVRR